MVTKNSYTEHLQGERNLLGLLTRGVVSRSPNSLSAHLSVIAEIKRKYQKLTHITGNTKLTVSFINT